MCSIRCFWVKILTLNRPISVSLKNHYHNYLLPIWVHSRTLRATRCPFWVWVHQPQGVVIGISSGNASQNIIKIFDTSWWLSHHRKIILIAVEVIMSLCHCHLSQCVRWRADTSSKRLFIIFIRHHRKERQSVFLTFLKPRSVSEDINEVLRIRSRQKAGEANLAILKPTDDHED